MFWRAINAKIFIFIMFLIMIFLLFNNAVNAEDFEVIFNQLDAEGDDYGAGYYYYPQNHIFQNKGNLFDIRSFTILESKEYYKFKFSFSKLTDPWGAKHGFSLPLIEFYIDNQAGGSNNLFYDGANVKFKADFYWDKFLKISGWWTKIFEPESKKENLLDINELSLDLSAGAESTEFLRNGDTVELKILKEELGSLSDSKIIILIGSFDPFGYDHFRSLSKKESYWQIYSKSNTVLAKSTRVLDILEPGGESQKEILKGEIPEVPYLVVDTGIINREKSLVDILMPVNKISLIILAIYLFILILTIYKFKYDQ